MTHAPPGIDPDSDPDPDTDEDPERTDRGRPNARGSAPAPRRTAASRSGLREQADRTDGSQIIGVGVAIGIGLEKK